MKFEKVVPVLRDGGSVHSYGILRDRYLKINNKCQFKSLAWFEKTTDKMITKFDGCLSIIYEEWEIYIKSKQFLSAKECMETLLAGDKIFVEHEGLECFYEIGSDGYIYDNDGEKRGINLGSHVKFFICKI